MIKSICAVILAVTISTAFTLDAKAYDSPYNNAAMISLASLLRSGAAISSTYNNTPSIYVHRRPVQDKTAPRPPKFDAMSFTVTPAAGR